MNLIHAALLLHSAGKTVNEENVKKIAAATGEKVEDAQIKALVAALEGVNIDDAISKAVSAPVAVATPSHAVVEKKEEVSEEEQEKKAEDAAAGLGSLFG